MASPTEYEVKLWNKLKSRQLGTTFTRQKIICGYIVDFYCTQYRIAIELDGRLHDKEADRKRDLVLNQVGVYVLRFNNYQLDENMDAIIIRINAQIASARKYREDKKKH